MATPTSLPATFVAGNVLTAAQMNNLRGAFRILQIVSTAKTDTFTTTSATFTDVTGLTATITPSSTSSKILVVAQVAYSMANAAPFGHFKINGGNTSSYVGAAAGNRIQAIYGGYSDVAIVSSMFSSSMVYLDSPATTSATTYAVQVRIGTTGTVYINRSNADANDANATRGASSITVMEISA